MNICKWCGRRPATEADHADCDTDPKIHLCWREWNDYSDCHDIERQLNELAPLMRDTILAWEASINATTREVTEDLYIKAVHMRNQVLDVLEGFPGGGGAVEKPRITPLPSAAGIPEDDDLDDAPLGKACSLDGDNCESCQ